MTEIEISKALALAIGWKRMLPNPEADGLKQCWVWTGHSWRIFDYRDWNVIGPIAARYRMFPQPYMSKWNVRGWSDTIADTPQKAIALAVIGANT